MHRHRILIGLAVAVVLAATVGIADACPTCKAALGSHDKAQGDIVSAYMYSILFMMAMPFVTISAFGTYLYFTVQRAKRARAETPQDELVEV
jgi:hypothetical protein